jgi:hypothetical protein
MSRIWMINFFGMIKGKPSEYDEYFEGFFFMVIIFS